MLPTTAQALLRRLAIDQAQERLPSVVASVVRDGQTVWLGARGEVGGASPTADTQYRIGSITKTFIAVMVMRLRDEGRLGLNDTLDTHVPGTPVGDRTIAELLSHTGGLTAEAPGEWWERIAGPDRLTLGPEVVRHRAGRRFHYSNVGYGLLGELVSRHRGSDWMTAVHKEILEPLGMNRTTFMPQEPHAEGWAVHPWADVLLPEPAHDGGAMAPAGQLWSTATDLARWTLFIGGDSGDVLHQDTVAEMREPAKVDDGDEWRSGYGLGFQLMRHRGRRLAGHTGSMPGFLATIWVDPADATGAFFLANTTFGVGFTLLTDLLDIMSEHEPRIPAEWTPQSVDPDLLELTGQWYWGPLPYVLRILPDGLINLSPIGERGRASRFRPEPDGTWLGLDGYHAGEILRVVRGPQGTHLDLQTFIFSRTPYDPVVPIPGGVDPDGWR
ncbi:serine hydrolase domain-containing protein [Rhizohabitans arisaemae]|uniref:serine hydrolase domain-containing protein n=1 Tax=Rhizohabitans arisaemae TaxID=2720610 RepID=UPI0024B1F49E|nr:serine hydrolase domain-containing protein [Rhizohabitans arisaemae]